MADEISQTFPTPDEISQTFPSFTLQEIEECNWNAIEKEEADSALIEIKEEPDDLPELTQEDTHADMSDEDNSDTADPRYDCDLCSKTFSQFSSLKAHMKLHTRNQLFVCDVCNKSFRHLGNLKTHLLIHTEHKSYLCDVCSKMFKSSAELTTHARVHSSDRPFVCDICSQTFKHSGALARHQLNQHGVGLVSTSGRSNVWDNFDKLPLSNRAKCRICAAELACRGGSTTGLLKHIRARHPLGQVADTSAELTVRGPMHSGIKPFTCDICSQTFKHSGRLAMHQRIHSGVQLVPQPKRSNVWNVFEKLPSDSERAKCKICGVELACTGGSTGGLCYHIRTKHAEVAEETAKQLSTDMPISQFSTPMCSKTVKYSRKGIHRRIHAGVRSVLRANRSDMWDYFEKLPAGKAKCKICGVELSSGGGSTSTLHYHLLSQHFRHLEAADAAKQTPTDMPLPQSSTAQPSESNNEQISAALAKVIVENMLPVSIVESQSVRDLFQLVAPQYSLPCCETMTSRLEHMKQAPSDKLLTLLHDEAEDVALTINLRASPANDADMITTASYINNDWTLQTRVLGAIHLEERYTETIISQRLEQVAQKWGIETKVGAIVHDVSVILKEAAKLNNWVDVNCAAELLHFNVTSSIGTDTVNNPIGRCVAAASRLVDHFIYSDLATNELTKEQLSLSPDKEPKKLVQYSKRRWNSVFDMLERLVDLSRPVTKVLSNRAVVELSSAKNLDLKDERMLMSDLLPVLKAVKIATSVLTADTGPSSSLLYPALWGLISNHLTVTSDDSPMMASFKKMLVETLEQRFGLNDIATAENVCITASVLDPNFKHLSGFSDELRSAAYDHVRQLLVQRAEQIDSRSETVADTEPPVKQHRAHPAGADIAFLLGERTTPPATAANRATELDRYLAFVDDPDESALTWWSQNASLFPTLATLARKYLAIPATSVQPGSLLSSTGRVITNADTLLFLNMNCDLFDV